MSSSHNSVMVWYSNQISEKQKEAQRGAAGYREDLCLAARAAPASLPADGGDPEDPVEEDQHRGQHPQQAVPAQLRPQKQLSRGRS